MASTGANALYNKVTSIFSGIAATAARTNGYTESYFYVGSTTASLPHLPSTNASQYPSLIKTLPYYTRVLDSGDLEVATTTQHWSVFETALVHNRKAYYVRPVRTENTVNGVKIVSESSYQTLAGSGAGLPAKTITYNYDTSGKEEIVESAYIYASAVYPELLTSNVISPIVRTDTRVNGISTGTVVSDWQKVPLICRVVA
jgi:hypothetical protein